MLYFIFCLPWWSVSKGFEVKIIWFFVLLDRIFENGFETCHFFIGIGDFELSFRYAMPRLSKSNTMCVGVDSSDIIIFLVSSIFLITYLCLSV